jgi:anti-sigma factor RsiW
LGQEPEFEENCERYLLGELSEAEREQFEEAYFTDDALFERFEAVKEEMLDAYARGELAEEKQKRFAEHFLTGVPRRRQLEEIREFIRAVTEVSAKTTGDTAVSVPAAATTQKSSWRKSFKSFFNRRPFAWQTAFAAVLLATLAGIWIVVRNWQPDAAPVDQASVQPTPLRTIVAPTSENDNTAIPANDNAATSPSPTPVSVNKPPGNTDRPAVNVKTTPTPKKPSDRPPQLSLAQIASVILMPVAARDISESNTLRLNSDTRTVRLSLVFKSGDYRSYSAALTTIEGSTVWRQNNLKAVNKSVTLRFAPEILRGQDYIATLKGTTPGGQTETIGEYYFRVERSPN